MAKTGEKRKKASMTSGALPLVANEKAIDPSLASLFASSSGPVTRPPPSRLEEPQQRTKDAAELDDDAESDEEELSSASEDLDIDLSDGEPDEASASEIEPTNPAEETSGDRQGRKRKRPDANDGLEAKYMDRLARDEEKEEKKRSAERRAKRQKNDGANRVEEDRGNGTEGSSDGDGASTNGDDDTEDDLDADQIPQHESLAPSKEESELEKSSRTVFLANVSTLAITSKSAKKTLLGHLASFFPSLPSSSTPHKVESLRFRSTAFSSQALPRKAAFAKKELMDATTKSTNAYAVYSSPLTAREATKRLNGTVVLERHLRVDSVAHPAKVDNKRCVFVGNLGFVDDDSMIKAAEDDLDGKKRSRKPAQPADVEEGLWQEFSKVGAVENVRVVRDSKTRVGKGIAYVQFVDPNSVEAALLYNEKKFPPLLPRKLRVTRAKNIRKAPAGNPRSPAVAPAAKTNGVYNPKLTPQVQSLRGRAGKLLGRAGAAQLRAQDGHKAGLANIARTPESFVFEGHRATSKSGKGAIFGKSGKGKKKGEKPRNRSVKRAAAWKAAGGKPEA
ncbi:MAG: hypothetical protein M1819_004603 [Sarea resinae]|nr:MAG: hypothetical protein M1819_004603 [Sarea resinae]